MKTTRKQPTRNGRERSCFEGAFQFPIFGIRLPYIFVWVQKKAARYFPFHRRPLRHSISELNKASRQCTRSILYVDLPTDELADPSAQYKPRYDTNLQVHRKSKNYLLNHNTTRQRNNQKGGVWEFFHQREELLQVTAVCLYLFSHNSSMCLGTSDFPCKKLQQSHTRFWVGETWLPY